MNGFFTWKMLLTSSGAAAATALITQLVKELPWVRKLPTRVLSYFIALAVMLLAAAATGCARWDEYAMAAINAVVTALAANGAFDAVNRTGK